MTDSTPNSPVDTTREGTDNGVPRIAAVVNVVGFLAGIGSILMIALDLESPIRVALVVILFTVGPGSGLVQFIRLRDGALQLGLIFALSSAIDILVSQAFLFAHNITGLGAVITLTVITCIRPIRLTNAKVDPVEPIREVDA